MNLVERGIAELRDKILDLQNEIAEWEDKPVP